MVKWVKKEKEKVKELSPKMKKVIDLLKLESDYINAYSMFDKYKNELEKVSILMSYRPYFRFFRTVGSPTR